MCGNHFCSSRLCRNETAQFSPCAIHNKALTSFCVESMEYTECRFSYIFSFSVPFFPVASINSRVKYMRPHSCLCLVCIKDAGMRLDVANTQKKKQRSDVLVAFDPINHRMRPFLLSVVSALRWLCACSCEWVALKPSVSAVALVIPSTRFSYASWCAIGSYDKMKCLAMAKVARVSSAAMSGSWSRQCLLYRNWRWLTGWR